MTTSSENSDEVKVKFLLEKLREANNHISFLANENDILLAKYTSATDHRKNPAIDLANSSQEPISNSVKVITVDKD